MYFFKSENAKCWPIWAILWQIFALFGFMDTFIVIVARQEGKKGWSFEWLSVLVTLEHSFMDDNEERNLAERLLSCSRVISSAGFMDGEKEILELLFPCRANSFSSAAHCLWIPRPLFSSSWAMTSSRFSWDATAVEFFNGQDIPKSRFP